MASQPNRWTTDRDETPPALKLHAPDAPSEGPPGVLDRRFWPWGVALAAAVGCGLVGVLISWMLLPARHTAITRIRITPRPVARDAANGPTEDAAAIRKAELEGIASDAVLKAVLERPGIAQLSVLAGQSDPVAWLRDNLWIRPVDGSNDVDICLSGEHPKDLTKLLYSLRDVYIDQMSQADHDVALRQRWEVEQRYQPLVNEVQQRTDRLNEALGDEALRQGKVMRLGATERILWAVSMAGNIERVRDFRNLLAEFDQTTQTLQAALDAAPQQSTKSNRPRAARPAKWMELMRQQAAQGIAPPAGTSPQEITAVIRQVDSERSDVQQEMEVAQQECDEANQALDALVASSRELQKRKAELLAYKQAMYQAEDQMLAVRAALDKPRVTEISGVTIPKTPVDDRRNIALLVRGLIASFVGFGTVLAIDGLLRRINAATRATAGA